MIRRYSVVFCALALTACGFHLRGSAQLPFTTLNIALPESSALHAELARTITSSSQTKIVDNPKEAQAVLSVVTDAQTKNILSLNSAGRVREYELVRTFVFKVDDAAGRPIVVPSRIIMRRSVTFNDDQVLSKAAEETLLWRDIQTDLLQQMLRRLAAASLKPAESQE